MRTNTGELVGFLDADSFYVSAERVRDRRLMGMPVAVLGNQGACVIARSYELRQTGVKVGDPVWEAAKICPQAVFIQRDFRWYEVLSRQMYEVVCSFSPCVEYYSIDEFFLHGAAPARRDAHRVGGAHPRYHPGADRLTGDGGDCPHADAGQAAGGHGQAVRGHEPSSIPTNNANCWPTCRSPRLPASLGGGKPG
jgi:nucleotidyltransferase/DNA polymerase involved in DNA repair